VNLRLLISGSEVADRLQPHAEVELIEEPIKSWVTVQEELNSPSRPLGLAQPRRLIVSLTVWAQHPISTGGVYPSREMCP
jgi:hypothetical protein